MAKAAVSSHITRYVNIPIDLSEHRLICILPICIIPIEEKTRKRKDYLILNQKKVTQRVIN